MQRIVSAWHDRLVIAIAALLFAIPAAILAVGPTPARFGFQMYSGYGDTTATWRDRDGRDLQVDLTPHLASNRTEIDWTIFLPQQLCARIPEAVSVEVSRVQPGGIERRRARC